MLLHSHKQRHILKAWRWTHIFSCSLKSKMKMTDVVTYFINVYLKSIAMKGFEGEKFQNFPSLLRSWLCHVVKGHNLVVAVNFIFYKSIFASKYIFLRSGGVITDHCDIKPKRLRLICFQNIFLRNVNLLR